jgi:uncharacterized FlaG/YvyC family protein
VFSYALNKLEEKQRDNEQEAKPAKKEHQSNIENNNNNKKAIKKLEEAIQPLETSFLFLFFALLLL